MSWFSRLVSRVPAGFAGTLDDDEHVEAAAESDAGPVVATSKGLWLDESSVSPATPTPSASRRIPWHLITKVTWSDAVLTVVEGAPESAGDAVVIVDRSAVRLVINKPGLLPRTVRRRVEESIVGRHRQELPDGGAWFVQRKVPGQGIVLQVRPDPGTDPDVVADIAADAAAKLRGDRP